MDKRWFNLIILTAIVLAGIIAYFFFFQAPSFSQRLEAMKASWVKAGLEAKPLHLSYDRLNRLSQKELSDLKAGLVQFTESEKNSAARELGEAYVSLIDISIYRQKMLEVQEEISKAENPCTVLPKYDLLTEYKESLLASTEEYLSKVDSFVSSNPEAAREAQIQAGSGAEELASSVARHKTLVAQLKEACK
ncbi:MAG: hypothetical protein QXK06_05725 [Candidatus Diapherotrites archaeon]